MMGVVNLNYEIGDRELQLVRPEPSRLVAGREFQTRPEIEQNIRGLGDDELAGFEERRRKGRTRDALAVEELHHRRHAAFAGPAMSRVGRAKAACRR